MRTVRIVASESRLPFGFHKRRAAHAKDIKVIKDVITKEEEIDEEEELKKLENEN